MGAIEDFDRVRFQGPTVPEEFSVAVGLTATRLVRGDPDRLSVTITNLGANPMYWSTLPTLTVNSAQLLGAGQTFVLQVQNDGALCGNELFGMMPAGAGTVNYLGLRRQKRG